MVSRSRGVWLTLRIPAFSTVANLLICLAYWAFERRLPQAYRPPLGKNAHIVEGTLKKSINFNTLRRL
jgi:hypothetical protein